MFVIRFLPTRALHFASGFAGLGSRIAAAVFSLFFYLGIEETYAAQSSDPPSAQQVREAVEQLKQDPALPGDRKVRGLKWKHSAAEQPRQPSSVPGWLRDWLRWMNESARILVWVFGGILVLALLWKLREFLGMHAQLKQAPAWNAASHVRALDIRPESLPDDVGAHALALWHQGNALAALSLLYRGALSRLVHRHGVPVRTSSTEGECMQLAATHLPATQARFFGDLVRAWQQAVYATRTPPESLITQLCREFSVMLDRPAGSVPTAAAP